MTLSLVVLAAGIGSRFGGEKQLAAVGPSGEVILDYTIHDALLAGFERIVLVVRSDIEDDVLAHVHSVFGAGIEVATVCQDTMKPAREKPWGTAHAVLTARPVVDGPFCVVNADDFYGRSSFAILADAMRACSGGTELQLVSFRLANTLSTSGSVSRGVCSVDERGCLLSVTEHLEVGRDGTMIRSFGTGETLAEDTPVSMQLWGLHPSVFAHLERRFAEFQIDAGDRAEFQLPTEIDHLVRCGAATVTVLDSEESWIGVTHPDDLMKARSDVAVLIDQGVYPTPLR